MFKDNFDIKVLWLIYNLFPQEEAFENSLLAALSLWLLCSWGRLKLYLMYLFDWILLLDHIYVALTQVLNFLAKLVIEEQRCGNAAVSRLAHRYDHPGTDAGQQEGQDAVQQEGD